MNYTSTQITVQHLDGKVLLYIRLHDRKVAETRELLAEHVLANFDKDGNLIGVEIIE